MLTMEIALELGNTVTLAVGTRGAQSHLGGLRASVDETHHFDMRHQLADFLSQQYLGLGSHIVVGANTQLGFNCTHHNFGRMAEDMHAASH